MNAWTNFSASEKVNMLCSLAMFLKWKNDGTLKTGVMAAKNVALPSQE